MRPPLPLTCVLAILLIPFSPAPAARAAVFTVNSPVDAPDVSPGDGICATTAGLCTLRAAVQEANATPAPDTITLPPGIYALSVVGRGEDLAATGDLDVTRPLTIAGAGPSSTIVDGHAADRIFHVIGPVAVQLSGVMLRNGNAPRPADISADGGGGAIYVVGGGAVTLTNAIITASSATSGTIAIDEGGSLALSNSTLSGNTASFGAGIFSNGAVTMVNSTISGNTASSSGGGIYVRQGNVSVVDSTISGNSASSGSIGGAGILVAQGAGATITGSLLSSNTATNRGGGIHTRGSISLTNSTVSGNVARNGGGGLYVGGGSTTLSNATLSGNSSDIQGGGISNAGGAALVRNTILANSTTGNCAGPITSLGYNLDSAQTCGLIGPGDLVGINPQLGPLQSNGGPTMTHVLIAPSAAIDAGSPAPPGSGGAACESMDQRGQRRPNDGNGDGTARCDIGAFEAPAVSVPIAGFPVVVHVPTPTATSAVLPPAASPTATFSSAPNRAPAPPTPVRVTTPPPALPTETAANEPTWALVTAAADALSVDGDPIGTVAAGEWYVVLAEEDGWLLVASDPDWPFWLPDDERVEVHRP